MSRRFFSSTATALVKFLGFNKEKLPLTSSMPLIHPPRRVAQPKAYVGVNVKLGKLKEAYIKPRNGNPVHRSHFNPADKKVAISARIVGSKDTKTCHIYADGMGTIKKGGDRS